MLDELRQIAIFAKTVDHGSFRAAARALRLSPSVVSHHVARLEKRLGTALLYRSTRKLSLTPDGQRLLASARTMMDAAESGLQDIANRKQQLSGKLRLTLPAIMTHSGTMEQIAEFALAYPQVQLQCDFSDSRRNLIADGFDVAIRVGDMEDSTLKARALFDIPRWLVAAPSYIDARQAPTKPADLVSWDWLEFAPVWNRKMVFMQGNKSVSVTKPGSQISVSSAHALPRLALAGAGLAVVPDFLAAPEVATGALQRLIVDWSLAPVRVFAVWPMNAPKDGLIRHFVNHLSDATKLDSAS